MTFLADTRLNEFLVCRAKPLLVARNCHSIKWSPSSERWLIDNVVDALDEATHLGRIDVYDVVSNVL